MRVTRSPKCRATLGAVALSALLTACGGQAPGTTAAGSGPGFGHVHGVDLNPADGLIYAATHHGMFLIGPAGPERIADRYQDTMGFTIAGPDLFLGSGHPAPDEPGPPQLGLIRSTDRAANWSAVSLAGDADFHALTASGSTVYGLDATRGAVMRSDDDGRTWQRGADLDAADLDVDPDDPRRLLATTAAGLLASTDGGLTFTRSAAQPPTPLLLVDHVDHVGGDRTPSAVGVDVDGTVWELAAGEWRSTGSLPGPPTAFTVIAADRYLAATDSAILGSEDAGRTWTTLSASES